MTEDQYVRIILVICMVGCMLCVYFYVYGKFMGRKQQYMLTEKEHEKSIMYDKLCNRIRSKLQRHHYVVIKPLAAGVSNPRKDYELYFHEVPDSDNKIFEPYDFSKN